MKAVGLRELKNRLSEYVRQVRRGEGVLVTDRGEVVAELAPPGRVAGETLVPSGLAALASQGLVTLGAPNSAEVYQPLSRLLPAGRAFHFLDAERGDR